MTRLVNSSALSQTEIKNVPLLILNLGLDIVDGVGGLHLKGDGLSGERLNENLHVDTKENVVE